MAEGRSLRLEVYNPEVSPRLLAELSMAELRKSGEAGVLEFHKDLWMPGTGETLSYIPTPDPAPEAKCPRCEGAGRYWDGANIERCLTCHGTGVTRQPDPAPADPVEALAEWGTLHCPPRLEFEYMGLLEAVRAHYAEKMADLERLQKEREGERVVTLKAQSGYLVVSRDGICERSAMANSLAYVMDMSAGIYALRRVEEPAKVVRPWIYYSPEGDCCLICPVCRTRSVERTECSNEDCGVPFGEPCALPGGE